MRKSVDTSDLQQFPLVTDCCKFGLVVSRASIDGCVYTPQGMASPTPTPTELEYARAGVAYMKMQLAPVVPDVRDEEVVLTCDEFGALLRAAHAGAVELGRCFAALDTAFGLVAHNVFCDVFGYVPAGGADECFEAQVRALPQRRIVVVSTRGRVELPPVQVLEMGAGVLMHITAALLVMCVKNCALGMAVDDCVKVGKKKTKRSADDSAFMAQKRADRRMFGAIARVRDRLGDVRAMPINGGITPDLVTPYTSALGECEDMLRKVTKYAVDNDVPLGAKSSAETYAVVYEKRDEFHALAMDNMTATVLGGRGRVRLTSGGLDEEKQRLFGYKFLHDIR